MRMVAATTGATVTGVTINALQVSRANALNKQYGLEGLATAVRANFLDLPFPDAAFDAAYAVEATCHAPVLRDAYAEIFRVLAPGGTFVSYEWLSTARFDPADPEHARIMAAINYGNGLPSMRTPAQAEAAARAAGFEVELSYDMAAAPGTPPGSWYARLARMRASRLMGLNAVVVRVAAATRLAPPGLVPVHDLLVGAAAALVEGGTTGIFTPAHLLVLRKPGGGGGGGGGGGEAAAGAGGGARAAPSSRLLAGLAAAAGRAKRA